MADTGDLKSLASRRAGSSPAISTSGLFPAIAGNFYFSYIFHEKQALSVMSRRLLYVFFLSVSILILTKFAAKYRPVRHTRMRLPPGARFSPFLDHFPLSRIRPLCYTVPVRFRETGAKPVRARRRMTHPPSPLIRCRSRKQAIEGYPPLRRLQGCAPSRNTWRPSPFFMLRAPAIVQGEIQLHKENAP